MSGAASGGDPIVLSGIIRASTCSISGAPSSGPLRGGALDCTGSSSNVGVLNR
jgi:hypothetical protein